MDRQQQRRERQQAAVARAEQSEIVDVADFVQHSVQTLGRELQNVAEVLRRGSLFGGRATVSTGSQPFGIADAQEALGRALQGFAEAQRQAHQWNGADDNDPLPHPECGCTFCLGHIDMGRFPELPRKTIFEHLRET